MNVLWTGVDSVAEAWTAIALLLIVLVTLCLLAVLHPESSTRTSIRAQLKPEGRGRPGACSAVTLVHHHVHPAFLSTAP